MEEENSSLNNVNNIAITIAKRLMALRLHFAWTREDLAERSNVNVYTLKRFERTGQISLDRLISIAYALGIGEELARLFKPRQRVNIEQWQMETIVARKRGKRRDANLTKI